MAVAEGKCPNCGAPISFEVGSSISKVCEYCRHTVLRSDRGLENLGKVADLAHTPALVAVGDEGTLRGRAIRILGRVQLDHGSGPWDEYYVSLDHGQAWGWLAYAQGHWYATSALPGVPLPAFQGLRPELDLQLPGVGFVRVGEIKTATVTSTEGELPDLVRVGQRRAYADCQGPNGAFATLDYGDGSVAPSVYSGWTFTETELQITELGPRSIHKLKLTALRCPNCGGDIPSLSGERAERVGCPYCGAVSDIAAQQVISRQEAARKLPDIPIGSRGTLEGVEYTCIAYLRRGSDFDGEHFSWEEYLLWGRTIGYRWLVKDPESGWSFVVQVNLSEIDLREYPAQVNWRGRTFYARNRNTARVEYVLGEVYWKVAVGDESRVIDFVSGDDVLSREQSDAEVTWSFSTPLAWPVVAQAFGLPVAGKGARFGHRSAMAANPVHLLLIVFVVLILCVIVAADEMDGGGSGFFVGGGTFRGGGVFSGGK